jgi:hypothetical protein
VRTEPVACSGDMYLAVPSTWLLPETKTSGAARAMPKSATLASPAAVSVDG